MDSHTNFNSKLVRNSQELTEHDWAKISNLMLRGYPREEAIKRYLYNNKDVIKAANEMHFDKLFNERFLDHTLAMMRSDL